MSDFYPHKVMNSELNQLIKPVGQNMTNDEIKELLKFILYTKSCDEVTQKINSIKDPFVLHTIAFNLEYHTIHYYASAYLCIEQAVINNPACDLGGCIKMKSF